MNQPRIDIRRSAAPIDLDELSRALAEQAPEQHRTGAGLDHSVALLRAAGLLADSGAIDPAATARRLTRIAGANLSVARLYEGHVNALRIVEMHGTAEQRARLAQLVSQGAFFGVWGADGADPVRLDGDRLAGAKIFASGLGTLTHAIITVNGGEPRIGIVDVTDAARHSPGGWAMRGMRATRSGGHDFTGIDAARVDWIGAPGCYVTEPGFVSGVWRIAALQLGATLGLLDAARRQLCKLDRMGAEAQLARLTPPLIRALGAEAFVRRAACFAESPDNAALPEQGVALSAAARLLTEEIAQQAIAAVEQSIGLSHFTETSETGRMAEDLATYLRQAARDALLQRTGRHAFDTGRSVWELLP
ncbi:MAG: acyl-CoA dehydrogenase [Celeribacter sp.]|jgi:hypothetical protein